MKIGRNDPCPCGSGKKYKKCHLNANNDPFMGMFQKESYEKNGLLIGRPVISTEFKGYKVVAVGSRLYHRLPVNITFHEFVVIFLKDIVGPSWGLEESKKPKEDQHIIVRWIKEMSELLSNSPSRIENPIRDIKSAKVSGDVQALLSLAYDIYSIYHCTDLPEDLINRLKNNDQFQGAKYEIAVAGIFARAGFNLKWYLRSSNKQGEFVATHRDTGEMITVEAKSRHREGVLNRPGQAKDFKEMRAQVGHLFNKALEKPDEGNPFMIFIDINLPLTEGENSLQKRWVGDIKKMMDQHPLGTYENPDPFTALFVTNFSWHYHGINTDVRKGETLTIIPLFPKIRTQDQNTITLLHKATEQYGTVPAMFPENR
ncbi:MAG TPA: SEC-C metal-binding domain-containing protein [Patescibacteria group bacterium]|nr:SEC-C metal-binding domain-containing protein [Patescibacteria group bacterium]